VVVVRVGTSSVTYRVGIFVKEDEQSKQSVPSLAAAVVDFTHVFVDPNTRKSIPMLEKARAGLSRILDPKEEKAKL
jgi:acyl-CoA thioesterase FadM